MFRQMTSNVGKREQDYLLGAASLPPTWTSGSNDTLRTARLVLLAALISTLEQAPATKAIQGVDIGSLKRILGNWVRTSVDSLCFSLTQGSGEGWDAHLAHLLATLDAAGALGRPVPPGVISTSLLAFLESDTSHPLSGHESYWDLKKLLVKVVGEEIQPNLSTTREKVSTMSYQGCLHPAPTHADFDKAKILGFVDTAIQNANEGAKLEYLHTLLGGLDQLEDATSQLLLVYRVVQHIDRKLTCLSPALLFRLSLSFRNFSPYALS